MTRYYIDKETITLEIEKKIREYYNEYKIYPSTSMLKLEDMPIIKSSVNEISIFEEDNFISEDNISISEDFISVDI